MKTNTHFRMRMFQTKVIEKIKTHILCSITFFRNCFVLEIICQNIVEPPRPQVTIWLMLIACRIPKSTNTHSEYVRNTYCSSTAKMAARTRLNVTLYVHCMPRYSKGQIFL
jgi:hypothetical protein